MAPTSKSDGNKFPRFRDGDVLVVLSPSNTYQLHARTLRLHSAVFSRMLSEDNAARLSSKAKRKGVQTLWRIDLKLPTGGANEANGWGELFPRHLDDHGRASSSNMNPDMDAGLMQEPAYKHYNNILLAFYSEPLQFNHQKILHALEDCHAVVSIAERLECMNIITMPVDSALFRFGQQLWHSIASEPAEWANLAFRLRSELLFREAVIHLVGMYPGRHSDDPEVRCIDFGLLKPEIRDLVIRKHKELDMMKKSVELRIIGHYPSHLQKPKTGSLNVGAGSVTKRGYGVPTRVQDYQKDIHGWMAMCLFRHWIGQCMAHDGTRLADDGGWKFYEAIWRSHDAYIDHVSIERFTEYFPLSAKSRGCFEEELGKLKDSVRSFVVSLMESKLHLDVEKEKLRYLTCTEIERDDLPWKAPNRHDRAPLPLAPFHDEDHDMRNRPDGHNVQSRDSETGTYFSPPAPAKKRKRHNDETFVHHAGPFQQPGSETDDYGMPAEVQAKDSRSKKQKRKQKHKESVYHSQVAQDAKCYPKAQQADLSGLAITVEEDEESTPQLEPHAAVMRDFKGRHDDVYSMDDEDEDAQDDEKQRTEGTEESASLEAQEDESDMEFNFNDIPPHMLRDVEGGDK